MQSSTIIISFCPYKMPQLREKQKTWLRELRAGKVKKACMCMWRGTLLQRTVPGFKGTSSSKVHSMLLYSHTASVLLS